MDQVAVGATRKDFVLEVVDENDVPINIGGAGAAFLLNGTSTDLPTKTIAVAGVITDAAGGKVTWSGVGGPTYITIADMGAMDAATFTFQVKWTDTAGKIDYSLPTFQWQYVKPIL